MDRCILKIVNKGKAVISMQFNKGTIKPTDNQKKILYKDLSKQGKQQAKTLASRLNKNSKFTLHCLEKVDNGEVVLDSKLLTSILNGRYSIIELNQTGKHKRVLLRSLDSSKYDNDTCNLCVVYQAYDDTIITMYDNKVGDNHTSIDLKRYSKKF